MNINFVPIADSHFPLLLKWLEMPYVKLWWDQEIKWNLELIKQKYLSYIKGYKLQNNEPKKTGLYCGGRSDSNRIYTNL